MTAVCKINEKIKIAGTVLFPNDFPKHKYFDASLYEQLYYFPHIKGWENQKSRKFVISFWTQTRETLK